METLRTGDRTRRFGAEELDCGARNHKRSHDNRRAYHDIDKQFARFGDLTAITGEPGKDKPQTHDDDRDDCNRDCNLYRRQRDRLDQARKRFGGNRIGNPAAVGSGKRETS